MFTLKKIRVALIGYGRSGRNIHRKLLLQLPDKYEFVAFVEQDKERREMIERENGMQALSDYRELFGRTDIDLVINASFSFDHARISYDLLTNGFDVLSEKPASGNVNDFECALKAAKEHGRQYFIFQQYRFAPAYMKMREIVASGKLGRPVQYTFNFDGFARRWDWQTVHGFSAGSLRNTGPHPMDWALDVMGHPQDIDVFCAMDRAHTYGDGEDYVKMILRAPGAPVCDIEISSAFGFGGKDTYQVHGTRGCLTGTDNGLKWKYYVDEEAPEQHLTTTPLRTEDCTPIYCGEELPMHEEEWIPNAEEARTFNSKGLNYYNALYDTLTTGAPFLIKNDEILLQLKITEEAYRQNADMFK